ncbi:hypothetical protein [Teichococcus aestuarii]|uniref:hypothetical protein n=1 Tax=Teichococcus aestuarii TaxID=568898 RepID=UPI0036211C94
MGRALPRASSTPSFRDAPEGASAGARPFPSVEEAWLWTMAALIARRDSAARPLRIAEAAARPGRPEDVLRILDRLYRQRRVTLAHLVVLRRQGERQAVPTPRRADGEARLWREAMAALAGPLRRIGLVEDRPPEALAVASPTGGTPLCLAADAALRPEHFVKRPFGSVQRRRVPAPFVVARRTARKGRQGARGPSTPAQPLMAAQPPAGALQAGVTTAATDVCRCHTPSSEATPDGRRWEPLRWPLGSLEAAQRHHAPAVPEPS